MIDTFWIRITQVEITSHRRQTAKKKLSKGKLKD